MLQPETFAVLMFGYVTVKCRLMSWRIHFARGLPIAELLKIIQINKIGNKN
jgi:hypothetical protein